MTPAEIAAIAGVHPSTVRGWVSGLPCKMRRTGGRPVRVYDLGDVIARLEAGELDNSKYVALIRAAM